MSNFGLNHPDIVSFYNNIGNCYRVKGNYALSLKNYNLAKEILQKANGEIHPKVSEVYNNIAVVHFENGDNDSSLEYYKKAVRVQSEISTDHPVLIDCYKNIGLIYDEKKNFEEALHYYHKSVEVSQKSLSADHPTLAETYLSIGNLLEEHGHLSEVSKYNQKVEKMVKNPKNANLPVASAFHQNRAISFYEKREFDLALKEIFKTIDIEKHISGNKSAYLSSAYNVLGTIYAKNSLFRKSLKSFQKAILSNIVNYSDSSIVSLTPLKNYLSPVYLLRSLSYKAESFENIFNENGDQMMLNLVFQNYHQCDSLVSIIRQSHNRHDDQLEVGKVTLELYTNSIRASLKLYQLTGKKKYNEYAFYFSERAKSKVLCLSISNQYAKQYGGIPDTLVSLINSLKTDKAFYITQINEAKAYDYAIEKSTLQSYENKLFQVNQQLDSMIFVLESNYSRYHQLKYDNQTTSSAEIQERLDPNSLLIEFFLNDSILYNFALSKNSLTIDQIPIDSSFYQLLGDFKSSLDYKMVNSQPKKVYELYTRCGYQLYHNLFSKVLAGQPDQLNKLIIIPSGELATIPLDLFLRNPVVEGSRRNYFNLDYMFKKYVVNYANSATLKFQKRYTTNSTKKCWHLPLYMR